ncbi:MAG TPA: EpsI family protein [Candidatus Omnitrophota bacterium]|nr:EpsI family protein [Candidatus Omnitrophota bacterium]
MVIFLIGFVAIYFFMHQRPSGQDMSVTILGFPLAINGWIGMNIDVDTNTKDLLETQAVLMRRYKKGTSRVDLAVVYYPDDKVGFHMPESCYTGQGSHIIDKDVSTFDVGNRSQLLCNRLSVRGNKGNEEVFYYFQSGNIRTEHYSRLRWQILRNKINRGVNGSSLIRLSSSAEISQEQAYNSIQQFVRDVIPMLTEYLHK